MKGTLRFVLVPLVALAFASLSYAQAKPATPATPATPPTAEKKMETKAEKPKASSITGEVVSVDAKAGTLKVKTKDKELSLTADSKSAKSRLEKIKAGDNVKVSYTEKDGKLIASSVSQVKVKTAAATKSETKEKAESKAKGMAKKTETKAEEKKAEKKGESKTEKK